MFLLFFDIVVHLPIFVILFYGNKICNSCSGPMAAECVQTYIDAAPNNDTLIYVGEGRGGANGDDYLFDILENGEWMLKEVIEVVKPPGDKGCEKLYVCSKLLPK